MRNISCSVHIVDHDMSVNFQGADEAKVATLQRGKADRVSAGVQ